MNPQRLRIPVLAAAVLMAACGAKHRLGEYDFRGGTLSASADVPAYPEVLTGGVFVDPSGDPIGAMVRMGARAARELSARGAQERLDSATALVDLAAVLEAETLRRAARYLGASPATGGSEATFHLEVFVSEYGIRATDWDAGAYFYLDAAGTLIDSGDGSEIWRAEIRAENPVGAEVIGSGAVRDVVTAASIAGMSLEEAVRTLEGLAEFAAGEITERLREDLAEARRNP